MSDSAQPPAARNEGLEHPGFRAHLVLCGHPPLDKGVDSRDQVADGRLITYVRNYLGRNNTIKAGRSAVSLW
jgi:hypothetical protein